MIISLIWVAVLTAVVLLYLRQVYSRFNRYGVKHFTPVPLLGNMAKTVFRLEHLADGLCRLYNSFPEERFVGRFDFFTETLVVRDLELVKKIAVKDFEHFLDHRTFETNSLFGRSLMMLKGQEWKDMRSTLSPAFTSSKIRLMIPFMAEVGDQMIRHLKKKIKDSKDGHIDLECKDLATRYANDVIASCAYGLKVDSFTDENNQFFEMGKAATSFKMWRMLLLFLLINVPKALKLFKLDIVSDAVSNFFSKLVLDTIKDRETNKIFRPDIIHLLMEAKKGRLSHEKEVSYDDAVGFATVKESSVGGSISVNQGWNDEDLIAQAFLFFFAGFESVSSTMAFLLYELACNPDVQERLAQEVKEYDLKNGGEINFFSVQSMTYLDMVVSESLRLWPPGIGTDRACTKNYNLGKPNNEAKQDFIIRKGEMVLIPIFAFHWDSKYFSNPEKFDPDRFSEENKHKIHPLSYMPFGIGPRNCIASRFALCELKVMVYQILRYIELSPCEKTCIPPKLDIGSLHFRLKGGHWLRFKLRKQCN